MSFIEDVKKLVGMKSEEVVVVEDEPKTEDQPEKTSEITDEEKTAIVAEVMQILEPRMIAIEERLTALEEAMTMTTDAAAEATRVAAEAKQGVTIIAKATGSKYVAPVAAAAASMDDAPKLSRVRVTKNL